MFKTMIGSLVALVHEPPSAPQRLRDGILGDISPKRLNPGIGPQETLTDGLERDFSPIDCPGIMTGPAKAIARGLIPGFEGWMTTQPIQF